MYATGKLTFLGEQGKETLSSLICNIIKSIVCKPHYKLTILTVAKLLFSYSFGRKKMLTDKIDNILTSQYFAFSSTVIKLLVIKSRE